MAGKKRMDQGPKAVVMDYAFLILTKKYGNIGLGLVRNGQGMVGGKQMTEADEKFYALIGQKQNLWRGEVAGGDGLIVTGPADTITVDGAVRSLSEVVEEFYGNEVDIQQAAEDVKLRGLKMILSFLEKFAVGESAQPRWQRLDLRIKMQNQYNLANSIRSGLLECGLEKGIIPPKYLIR